MNYISFPKRHTSNDIDQKKYSYDFFLIQKIMKYLSNVGRADVYC